MRYLLERDCEDHSEVEETKHPTTHPLPATDPSNEDRDGAAEREGDDQEVDRHDEVSEPEAPAWVTQEPVHAIAPCPKRS